MDGTTSFKLSPHHTALRCLFVVALHKGVQLKAEDFAQFNETDTLGSVLHIMNKVALRGKLLRSTKWNTLTGLSHAYPVMALQAAGHWVVVVNTVDGPDGPAAAVLDPLFEQNGIQLIPRERFLAEWSGSLILCGRTNGSVEEPQRFGLRWFVPDILRHRRFFRDVAVAATMNNAIAFAMPLMFQLLLDKVITHRSYQTLTALMLIFGVLTLFDSVFNYVRQYLMLLITSKIDAGLASRTFQHLLSLPMQFFESTTAGVLVRHLQQTDTIRLFLTGRLFGTMLDATALPLMLTMLLFYSIKLTLVVLFCSLAIAAVIGIMVPTFRRQLEQLYQAEGARQAHLVETIHGMRTVKSLALENTRQSSWDAKVACHAATTGQCAARRRTRRVQCRRRGGPPDRTRAEAAGPSLRNGSSLQGSEGQMDRLRRRTHTVKWFLDHNGQD